MAQLLSLFLITLPFFVVLILANLADRARPAPGNPAPGGPIATESGLPVESAASRRYQVWAFGILGVIYGFFILAGIVLHLGATTWGSFDVGAAMGEWLAIRFTPDRLADLGLISDLLTGNVSAPLLAGAGLWLSGGMGILLLLPRVRRDAARVLAIDPARTVHAVALSFTALVVANLLFALGIGLGNLGEIMAADGIDPSTFGAVWSQQLVWAFLAFVGVGWLTRRNLGETLTRLGLTRPSVQGVVVAIGLAISAVFGVITLQGVALLLGLGPDPEVTQLSEELIGPLTQSMAGVLTLGLAAAIGEETLLRGALQPRFGLVATALVFALLHSNYGITFSTLVVFLLGLLLGWVRNHYNTVTSMIVHALYNMSLGLLAYLAARLIS